MTLRSGRVSKWRRAEPALAAKIVWSAGGRIDTCCTHILAKGCKYFISSTKAERLRGYLISWLVPLLLYDGVSTCLSLALLGAVLATVFGT
jgi:hypothetical protein